MGSNPDFDGFDAARWQFAAVEFWAGTAHWPLDDHEHVFLGRALQQLGAAAEPAWDDRDTVLLHAPLFIKDVEIDLRGPEQGYAVALLQEFRPDLNISAERLDDGPLTIEEWEAAFDVFDEHQRDARLRSASRVAIIIRWMVRLFAHGDLVAATRQIEGDGIFRPVEQREWNRDGTERRFAFCLMSRTTPPDETDSLAPPSFWKAAPRALIAEASWPEYLFVTKASLANVLVTARAISGATTVPAPAAAPRAAEISGRAKAAKRPYRKFDWPAFRREVNAQLDENGDIDTSVDALFTKASLKRVMEDWCSTTWGVDNVPEDSQVRAEIDKVIVARSGAK